MYEVNEAIMKLMKQYGYVRYQTVMSVFPYGYVRFPYGQSGGFYEAKLGRRWTESTALRSILFSKKTRFVKKNDVKKKRLKRDYSPFRYTYKKKHDS
jgi:hypothetical protein